MDTYTGQGHTLVQGAYPRRTTPVKPPIQSRRFNTLFCESLLGGLLSDISADNRPPAHPSALLLLWPACLSKSWKLGSPSIPSHPSSSRPNGSPTHCPPQRAALPHQPGPRLRPQTMPTLRPRKRQSEAPAAAAARSSSQSKVATTAPVSTAVPASSSTTKKRTTRSTKNEKRPDEMTRSDEEHHGLLDGDDSTPEDVRPSPESLSWAQRNQWIVFALASGACAAFNGVFAKL